MRENGATSARGTGAGRRPVQVDFPVRFGPAKWLSPTQTRPLRRWQEGGKQNHRYAPGFISDCVETLEEIGIGVQEIFMEAGGTHFSTVPCLNADPPAITLLHKIAKRELPAGYSLQLLIFGKS